MKYEKKQRPIIGVITAIANSIEQRKILSGIIEQAQLYNMDTAVFSNIYNSNQPEHKIEAENKIYDLALSDELDALIIISESFVNTELRKNLRNIIIRQLHLPVVVAGTAVEEFSLPGVRFINTSDVRDIEDIATHLIEEHNFRSIDILTGFPELEVSHLRVEGYRNALESHGIPFDESRVHYGTFWMESGEELAEKYISGELPFPEAVICTNDYMAYGMLDKFMDSGIAVPEKISVTGYEDVQQRIFYSPLLTTYQRNRAETGRRAVKIVYNRLNGKKEEFLPPPSGKLIHGESCPCRCRPEQINEELKAARLKNYYESLNLFSQMEPQLTECHNLEEFIGIAGEYQFLVRYVQNIFLCLSENWCDTDNKTESSIITFRSIMPWLDNTPVTADKYQISRIFSLSSEPAVYYFNPLFYGTEMFGYLVLKYDTPDTYDDAYRNWIKSVSNGLAFMRMKNDIKYLMECRNLSEQYDSITGLYSSKSFEKAVNYSAEKNRQIILILMKTNITSPENSLDSYSSAVSISKEIAEALKLLYHGGKSCHCGKIDRNLYAFSAAGDFADNFDRLLTERLIALMIHKTSCVREYGLNSFQCAGMMMSAEEFEYETASEKLMNEIRAAAAEYAEKNKQQNFEKFSKCRDEIYLNPAGISDPEIISRDFCFSTGHFRHLYKSFFEVSFHQDCILSRMTLAKYLLCSVSMDISTVSEKCGYEDPKYFTRLFHQNIGYTPVKYRELF